MTVRNQVHNCISRNSNPSTASFCACCGVYMSQLKTGPVFFRTQQYRVTDPFRLDANLLLSEMIKKQNNNRIYVKNAHFVKYRSELLRFLKYLRARLEYSQRTYYLAVSILDCFLSQYKVENDHLKLFCFMALHMTAKMEENSPKVPEISVIIRLFENKYSDEDIENWEIAITKAMNYNLNLKTPYTFVEHFLSKGIVCSFDLNCRSEVQADAQLSQFEDIVMELLDLSSTNYDFYNYSPVNVACAVIACARKSICIKSTWSADLELLTTKKIREFEECLSTLLKLNGDASDLMEVENTKNVKVGPAVRAIFTENNSNGPRKMAVESSNVKRDSASSDTMVIDTDEEEPIKNATVYNSRRVA